MPVNLTYSFPSPGVALVEVELYDLTVGEMLTVVFEGGGATLLHEVTSSLAATEIGLLLTAIEDFVMLQGADGYWETVSTSAPGLLLEVVYSDAIGDLLITSDGESGGPAVTTRIWRGDAPAVAQVTRVTPAAVQTGDVFSLAINGKAISVTSTAATAANVVALFVAAIAASDVAEWTEVEASADEDTLLLTAAEPGVPFAVAADASNGSSLGVTVDTTVAGVAGSNQTQTFRVPLSAAGTFTITIGDQTTSGLAVGASAGTVETAVEGLSTIGASNVAVAKSSDANDDLYEITFTGALAATAVAEMIVELTSTKPVIRTTQAGATTGGSISNEIQTVDCGAATSNAFSLTLDGQTTSPITSSDSAATLAAALEALSNIVAVTVTKTGSVFTVEFEDIDGNADQSQLTAAVYNSSATSTHRPDVAVTAAVAAVNEQQTVTLNGSPTGGTYTLTYSGQTTSGVAYNASAGTVEAALEALSNIGVGDVAVTGSAGGPWTVTFQGALAATNVTQMTANGASLTGGTSEALSLTAVVASSGPHHWDTAANWLPSGVPVDTDSVRFELGTSDCLYGLDQSGVTLTNLHVASTYTGAIGLPRINDLGYLEYRTRDLAIECPVILIGHGSGSGSGKIQLNTLSAACAMEIRGTGGSRESGVPAVTWYGDHADNTILLRDGDLGVAIWSDQAATIDRIDQYGGALRLDHAAVSALYCSGQRVSAHESTLGGQPLEL